MRNKIFYTVTSNLIELIYTPIAFLINAKNIPKYSFRGFRGVNVSKSREIALSHCGCSLIGFTIFADHFIIFNLNRYGMLAQIFGLILSFLSYRWLGLVLDWNSSQEYSIPARVPLGSISSCTGFEIRKNIGLMVWGIPLTYTGKNIFHTHKCNSLEIATIFD